MSEAWKAKRAKQARRRRANKKKRLEILKEEASGASATTKNKTEFLRALEKERSVLDYDKQRIAKRRIKLKNDIAAGIASALEKAEKTKKRKHIFYIESKAHGNFKT